jgi:Uma2 family endonuclease
MDVLSHKLTSVEQFLAWVAGQEGRFELVNGEIRMMTGATNQHNIVKENVAFALMPAARKSGCRATTSDTGVRTGERDLRYPDVVVDCGPVAPTEMTVATPTIIVEVSSPSTRESDLGVKLSEYQHLPSVQVIIQIEPDVVLVAVHRRMDEGGWRAEVHEDLASVIDLPSLGGSLPLQDIYFGLDVKPRPKLQLVETELSESGAS